MIVEQVDDAFEQETKIPMTRTAIERLSVDQIAWLTGEQPPTPLIIRQRKNCEGNSESLRPSYIEWVVTGRST